MIVKLGRSFQFHRIDDNRNRIWTNVRIEIEYGRSYVLVRNVSNITDRVIEIVSLLRTIRRNSPYEGISTKEIYAVRRNRFEETVGTGWNLKWRKWSSGNYEVRSVVSLTRADVCDQLDPTHVTGWLVKLRRVMCNRPWTLNRNVARSRERLVDPCSLF